MTTNPFRLKKTIGDSYTMDLDDSLNTKKALADLGHLKIPDYGLTPYPDRAMVDGVKSFQKDHGLKIDGVMKKDGPTINRLNPILTSAVALAQLLWPQSFLTLYLAADGMAEN